MGDGSSVFNAELEGILLTIKKFLTLPQYKRFIIYTDSLSAVESLRNKTFKTKNVKRFYNLLKKIPPQTQLVIAWVPSHVGISGNEKADRLAKAALTSSLAAHSQVCWSDLKPRVDTYICTAWQALWNIETRIKLYEIRPNLKESLRNTTQSLYRKQETVMTRLRIGHTWITHSYLLKKEDQPFCHACDNPFTVKHILVECSDFTYIRNKYYRFIQQLTFTYFSERLIPPKSLNSSRKSSCSTKCKFTSNTIYRETRICNIYIYIHLLTLYKLTPIGHIVYNFYHF